MIDEFVTCAVLPAKSDSDVMFVYKVSWDFESIDNLCINPIHRIGLIHKWSLDVNVLLNNFKLLVGSTL